MEYYGKYVAIDISRRPLLRLKWGWYYLAIWYGPSYESETCAWHFLFQ